MSLTLYFSLPSHLSRNWQLPVFKVILEYARHPSCFTPFYNQINPPPYLRAFISCTLSPHRLIAVIYMDVDFAFVTVAGIEKTRNDWQDNPKGTRCLTGYMTDLQSWVDEHGELTPYVDINEAIDMSARHSVVKSLEQELSKMKFPRTQQIKFLSLAKCYLTRVPSIFQLEDNHGRRLADTLEFLTLYGNNFGVLDPFTEIYDAELNVTNARLLPVPDQSQKEILTTWSVGLQMQPFRILKELDLRACSIQVLGDNSFQGMPELKKLYLSENNIHFIETHAFDALKSLKHLDLSRNYAYDETGNLEDLVFDSVDAFKGLKLESLDFSFTRLGQQNHDIFRRIGKTLKRLSLCYSSIGRLRNDAFNATSLKLLDISGNIDVLSTTGVLRGTEKNLEILYADNVSLKNMEGFMNFLHLKILKLSNNDIHTVPVSVAKTLTSLQILDLDNNRMTSWSNSTFSLMPKLKLLSLKNNNINIISREMYHDIENISFLALSGNFIVCNCHARDMFEVASNNELLFNSTYFNGIGEDIEEPKLTFHTGFKDFNKVIRGRRNITTFCEEREDKRESECNVEFNHNVSGNYLLLDYTDYSTQYKCLLMSEGKSTGLYNVPSCTASNKDLGSIDVQILDTWNKYKLLLVPTVLLPVLFYVYVFRKNFKYFLITIRNSATLSLINKNDFSDDGSIFHYDVFVSYCNEDRAWVLDDLLPHVEKDCNVSVCLHERDFQVGLSILENIVSCMDRSRMIMLIISKRFLLSQWCQFEMHLAQHRLLETRREDLILVLLEEIPRSMRPNTLHYLMLTKTYIVWPQEVSERSIFWRRMKKSLVTHKLKSTENMSLA